MEIGDRIKDLRIHLNLSQTELADKIGSTKQNIYKYENGLITNIPSDKIEQLASALNTTPAYLMGWTDNDISPSATKKIAVLARSIEKLPEEDRNKLIQNFEDTIDIYLKARGIKDGD